MFVFDQLRSKDLPIRLMVIFILCCMLLLVGKLWNLQVATAADYRSQQENQSVRAIRLPATRGIVRDARGRVIATNRPSYDVYLTPQLLSDEGVDRAQL